MYSDTKSIDTNKLSIKSGIAAGVLIFGFLSLIDMSFHEVGLMDKFLKYLLLFGVLGIAINRFYQNYEGKYFFRRAMKMGLKISLIAGFSLVAFNFIYWMIFQELPIDRFRLNDHRLGNMLVLQGTMLFEMFVAGMILNFAWLQFFKGDKAA